MITRRTFLCGLTLGTLVAPLTAAAQQAPRVYRIGFLSPSPSRTHMEEAFLQGLREHGLVEGQNIRVEWRFAAGRFELLSKLAEDLVHLDLEVLVGGGTGATRALKHVTSSIPIVMLGVGNAVESGIVPSLSRPQGNITGTSPQVHELTGKRLAFLKEVVPRVQLVAVLVRPDHPISNGAVNEAQAAARTLGVQLAIYEVRGRADLTAAFAAMKQNHVGGLLVIPDAMLFVERARIADLALKHRLPAIDNPREFTEAGGLLSYGANMSESARRAAMFVDKILKGDKPADLPVEQPTKFELVINLKTAKALGLTIPPSVLGRADHVIE